MCAGALACGAGAGLGGGELFLCWAKAKTGNAAINTAQRNLRAPNAKRARVLHGIRHSSSSEFAGSRIGERGGRDAHTSFDFFLGARRKDRKIRFPEHPHCPECFLRPHTLSKPARRRNRFLTTGPAHPQSHCILCICCRRRRDRCTITLPNDLRKRLSTEVRSMNHSRPSSRLRVG